MEVLDDAVHHSLVVLVSSSTISSVHGCNNSRRSCCRSLESFVCAQSPDTDANSASQETSKSTWTPEYDLRYELAFHGFPFSINTGD